MQKDKLFTALFLLLAAHALADQIGLEQAPQPVKNAVTAWSENSLVEDHSFSILSVNANNADAFERTWLIVASNGQMGRLPLSETRLFTEAGFPSPQLPRASVSKWFNFYHQGIHLQLSPEEFMFAFSVPSMNGKQGFVEISATTGKHPGGILLLTDAKKAQDTNRSRFCESMYYFADADGDGRTDILINRRIHTRQQDGSYKYQNQKLACRILQNDAGIESMSLSSEELTEHVRKCKMDASIPHIGQQGIPFENTDSADFGEAIFPEEEQWRKVKYTDTFPPDFAADSDAPMSALP